MGYTEKDREYLVEWYRIHLADLIPYDDPNYEKKLNQWAEESAENDIHPNPEFEAYMKNLCEEHDRMLEEGLLDDIHGPYEC